MPFLDWPFTSKWCPFSTTVDLFFNFGMMVFFGILATNSVTGLNNIAVLATYAAVAGIEFICLMINLIIWWYSISHNKITSKDMEMTANLHSAQLCSAHLFYVFAYNIFGLSASGFFRTKYGYYLVDPDPVLNPTEYSIYRFLIWFGIIGFFALTFPSYIRNIFIANWGGYIFDHLKITMSRISSAVKTNRVRLESGLFGMKN